MIRLRNVAYENATASLIAVLAAGTYKFGLFVNNTGRPLKIRKVSFAVPTVAAGGTSVTADIHKNGATVLSTVPVVTRATTAANTKFDTAREFGSAAPTGVSALPVLSSTDATITVKPGDCLELATTSVGVYTGAGACLVATVHLEYVPA
jgi:hypothetical protein